MVDRARWVVILPRMSEVGMPAFRQSTGTRVLLTYFLAICRHRNMKRKWTNSPVFSSSRGGCSGRSASQVRTASPTISSTDFVNARDVLFTGTCRSQTPLTGGEQDIPRIHEIRGRDRR